MSDSKNLVPDSEYYFFIKSKLNGLVLDVCGSCTDPGTRVIGYTQRRSENLNQLWSFECGDGDDDQCKRIISVESGLCLQVNDNNSMEVQPVQKDNCSQQWQVLNDQICNHRDTTKVLNVMSNDADCFECDVDVCKFNGGKSQGWEIEYILKSEVEATMKQFFIISRLDSELVLAVDEEGCVKLQKQCYEDNSHQLWSWLTPSPGILCNSAAGNCLELIDKNQLYVKDCTENNTNQIWAIDDSTITSGNKEAVLAVRQIRGGLNFEVCTETRKYGNKSQCWDFEHIQGNRAPSVGLSFDDDIPGDILMIDSLVPKDGLAQNTYYCMLQWNNGQSGSGYCGIQCHPRGNNFIFSIWDPETNRGDKCIEAIYTNPGTEIERFGGEGTGLKSWNFSLGWKTDEWMTFVARRWNTDDDSTCFGYWVQHQSQNKWTHLVTMKFPEPGVQFNTETDNFLEDWMGNGKYFRSATYRNGYKRSHKGDKYKWVPFHRANFSVVREDSSSQYSEKYSAVGTKTSITMSTGGKTPSKTTVQPKCINLPVNHPVPDKTPIAFTIVKATSTQIKWNVAKDSIPQFAYTITNQTTGVSTSRVINSHCLCIDFNSKVASKVIVTLEDILGQSKSKTVVIK